MAVLRPHLALTVSDVERSSRFYTALFGTGPAKVRPGYAKFELPAPALNFTLNEGAPGDRPGAFNHAGIEVGSTDEVLAAQERLRAGGLATFEEMDTDCCYARQDKVWVTDPAGTRWEIYTVRDDVEVEEESGASGAAAERGRCCPTSAGSACCA